MWRIGWVSNVGDTSRVIVADAILSMLWASVNAVTVDQVTFPFQELKSPGKECFNTLPTPPLTEHFALSEK